MASRTEISTFTVKLDPVLLSRFKAVCATQHRSMSGVTREFVAWYVEREQGASSEPQQATKKRRPRTESSPRPAPGAEIRPEPRSEPPSATPHQPEEELPPEPPPASRQKPSPAYEYQSDLMRRMRER